MGKPALFRGHLNSGLFVGDGDIINEQNLQKNIRRIAMNVIEQANSITLTNCRINTFACPIKDETLEFEIRHNERGVMVNLFRHENKPEENGRIKPQKERTLLISIQWSMNSLDELSTDSIKAILYNAGEARVKHSGSFKGANGYTFTPDSI